MLSSSCFPFRDAKNKYLAHVWLTNGTKIVHNFSWTKKSIAKSGLIRIDFREFVVNFVSRIKKKQERTLCNYEISHLAK